MGWPRWCATPSVSGSCGPSREPTEHRDSGGLPAQQKNRVAPGRFPVRCDSCEYAGEDGRFHRAAEVTGPARHAGVEGITLAERDHLDAADSPAAVHSPLDAAELWI